MSPSHKLIAVALIVAASACASSPQHQTSPPTSTTDSTLHIAEPRSTVPATKLLTLTIAAPTHQQTYDRAADFGSWIDIAGCKNTRAELLIRASSAPVTYTSAKDCTVKTGRWTDPWSNTQTTSARALQIDHTVPLANAWASGVWSWSHDQRVAYTNDLTDADHLVPILDAENESKGDDGPESWRPPDHAAWCRYALDWDHIKAKWHLSATTAEWNAVLSMAASC